MGATPGPARQTTAPPAGRHRQHRRARPGQPYNLMLSKQVIKQHSQLTGPIQPAPKGRYRVKYRPITTGRELVVLMTVLLITLAASGAFFVWLIEPSHYPQTQYMPLDVAIGSHVMYWAILTVEGLRLLNSTTLCWAAATMRDPIPVEAPKNWRVAFITPFVPAKESIAVLRETLVAAKALIHDNLDVWVLDEGRSQQVIRLCRELGVFYFSRNGVPEWKIDKGPKLTAREKFGACTKHGNINAWIEYMKQSNIWYHVVAMYDNDHTPLDTLFERYLGYFWDPNVAYVVGPQVYTNALYNWIARACEAMNHMFHSVIQPSGNHVRASMFVGTSVMWRWSALMQIGGMQPSITEDLATAYAILGSKNPTTGKNWEAVYTRDVLSHGEGPDNWAAMFKQQQRWARGADELMVTKGFTNLRKLPFRRKLHYITLMLHYPTVAITWLLGVALTILYMTLGTTGIEVHINQWAAFYVDVLTMRLLLYLCLRRFNISPYEKPGSFGMSGIFMSVLCTPFYASALVGAVVRRKLAFDVTPKGGTGDPDRLWQSFRKHWMWAFVSLASAIGAILLGHTYPGNMIWALLSFTTCMLPMVLWGGHKMTTRLRMGSKEDPPLPPPREDAPTAPLTAVTTVKEVARAAYPSS